MSTFQDSIVAKLRIILQGEPLRAISYGSTAVVWIASNAASAAGLIDSAPISFDESILVVAAAVATVTELARRYVFSPITVERIISEAFEAGSSQ
jgi:hypothetical protein